MREIKFRAWDVENEMMCTVYHFQWMDIAKDEVFVDCIPDLEVRGTKIRRVLRVSKNPVMQFTGLLDKNGKEIYEGDIVKWVSIHGQTKRKHIDKIVWESDAACFMLRPWIHEPYAAVMEVIGNIYENPELLK